VSVVIIEVHSGDKRLAATVVDDGEPVEDVAAIDLESGIDGGVGCLGAALSKNFAD
jgi:hypothetical protein